MPRPPPVIKTRNPDTEKRDAAMAAAEECGERAGTRFPAAARKPARDSAEMSLGMSQREDEPPYSKYSPLERRDSARVQMRASCSGVGWRI